MYIMAKIYCKLHYNEDEDGYATFKLIFQKKTVNMDNLLENIKDLKEKEIIK